MASDTTTEILVHITASSRASDDAAYRALASAYLAFEPAKRIDLPEDTAPEHPVCSADSFISPQASFRSVWDNIGSPRLASREPQLQSQDNAQPISQNASRDGEESQDSWVAPPSEVADSMPNNDISLAGFCTPTRALNYFLQVTGPSSGSSPEVFRNYTGTSSEDHDGFTSLVDRGSPVPKEHALVPSAQPTQVEASSLHQTPRSPYYTLEDDAREPQVARTPASPIRLDVRSFTEHVESESDIQQSQQSQRDDSHDAIIPVTPLVERADSEPPPSKRLKRRPIQDKAQVLSRSKSDVLPGGWGKDRDPQQVSAEEVSVLRPLYIDWSHETQIISSEPLVSNHHLGTRAPVCLEDLAKTMEMERRYQPSYKVRDMRPYERGYWLMKLDGLEHQEKVELWGFLGNYICRDNKAGWGTRACRDKSWNWVRLYGWEHISGELYILLYVASKRLVKCMELSWFDGAGNVLVTVGARSDRRRLA